MHISTLWRSCITALLIFPCATFAEETETRAFSLPSHGTLQLKVPKSWQSKVSQSPGEPSPSIVFFPQGKPAFLVLLSPIRAARPDVVLSGPAEVRKNVEQAAELARPHAVEKAIQVRELKGPSIAGYYFQVTDKAPKPDEYKYMTQGMARLDTLLVTFTALTNDGQEHVSAQMISLLESAGHTGAPSAAPGSASTPRREAIQITRQDNNFLLTVPVSRLTMSIPAAGLTQRNNAIGGSTDSPRYFYFHDSAKGLTISGWFEHEQGYKGVKKLWESDTDAWKKRKLPEPRDVTFTRIGNWETIFYDNEVPAGTNSHIRAHWVQAGTWIDIHLSVVSKQSSKQARAEIEALLKTITVAEK